MMYSLNKIIHSSASSA